MKSDIYQNTELLLLKVVKLFQEAAANDEVDAKIVEMTLGKYREATAFCFIIGGGAFVVVIDWPVSNEHSCQCATRELYDILKQNKWMLVKLEHANVSYTPQEYAKRIYERLTSIGKHNMYKNFILALATQMDTKPDPDPVLTEDAIRLMKKVDDKHYVSKIVSSVTRQNIL